MKNLIPLSLAAVLLSVSSFSLEAFAKADVKACLKSYEEELTDRERETSSNAKCKIISYTTETGDDDDCEVVVHYKFTCTPTNVIASADSCCPY